MLLRGLLAVNLALIAAPAQAVGGTGAESQAARIERFIQQLGSEEFEAREKATRELRAIGAPARGALEKAVGSPDAEVSERSRRLLQEITWKLPPELARKLGSFAEQFAGYLKAQEPAKLRLLSGLRSRAPAEAERYMLQAARELRSPQAQAWLAGLLRIYGSRDAEAAILAASRAEDRYCRSTAASALARFESREATARLYELAGDDDGSVRRAALESIGRRARPAKAASALVLKRLEDADETVRRAAAGAAGRIGDRKALEPLWKLTADREISVRTEAVAAIAALAEFDEKPAAERLLKLLGDPMPAVRSVTLSALVNMRARSAAPELAKLLADGDTDLAAGAARALGVLGGDAQREALRRALEESKARGVRIAASRALVLLGDPEAPKKVARMLFAPNATTALAAAETLGLTGNIDWTERLAKAEKHWASQSYRLSSLQIRAIRLRDRMAFMPLAGLLKRDAPGAGWDVFLSRHALFAEAAKKAEESSATSLDEPDALSRLGIAQVAAGRAGEGLAKMRLAASMDPLGAVNLNNLAWFLLVCPDPKHREPARALKLAERAARLQPRSGYIADTLAWALYHNNKLPEALEAIDEALLWARPGHPDEVSILRAHRARILLKLGRREEALKDMEAARKLSPRDPELAAELARAYCQMGEASKALPELSRMLGLTYPDVQTLRLDPELEGARKSPEFKKLLERAEDMRKTLRGEIKAAGTKLPRPELERRMRRR